MRLGWTVVAAIQSIIRITRIISQILAVTRAVILEVTAGAGETEAVVMVVAEAATDL
jgi:UDP-N-acetyl-D-mannosaminuronate dehydrogenase